MKVGIICPSEIAFRRFLPAISKTDGIEYVGVGKYSVKERFGDVNVDQAIIRSTMEKEKEKTNQFVQAFGGKVFDSYQEIVESNEIDAIYIPLPPALHYKWAKCALESGKHVLVEKPATLNKKDTQDLIRIANKNRLAFQENYMFVYHDQIREIMKILDSGEIGDIRLIEIKFGFPKREKNDFRYNKELGGGALFDAGGYTFKFAQLLLGDNISIDACQKNYIDGYNVDMYGSAVVSNNQGMVAHLAYGMDNDYACKLSVWGSEGQLTVNRVLTAPAGFEPTAIICKNNNSIEIKLPADDTFKKSIEHFMDCVSNKDLRLAEYVLIEKQANLIESVNRREQII